MAPSRSDSPLLFDLPVLPDFSLEAGLMRDGLAPVAGLDEVGRGPLAGPVVAAAVVLDPERVPQGLDDSKRLSAAAREGLFRIVAETALSVSVASLSAASIDGTDIRKASLEAMRRALDGLALPPAFALADGRDVPPGLACPCRAIVKGDRRSASIAAASIVAKVVRDRMMARAGAQAPQYGFDSHVGYATKQHRAAIAAHGALPRLHRMSFAPLRPAGASAR
ncbi:ribonuclease HII [Chelativorans intermedius]|uniref:Ribonuclease HII n=1 Tax=Chelativorans intermedius TaxID=515947 RepID=A0ABV6D9D8_9HYPH|nr:ribonuclease HII [Chelativorans intermedius]MCT8998604.1 ribonuclease HII [Chelativorans intermedius]